MKPITKEILDSIHNYTDEHHITTEDLIEILRSESTRKAERKIIQNVDENKKLLGKCFVSKPSHSHGMFPPQKRFYKVISPQSVTKAHVECLVFNEHPTYWFDYQIHKLHYPGDFYLGEFDFESFTIEHVLASTLMIAHKEISEDEYNMAAQNYLNELLKLSWSPNHYRMGGKMPTDDDWSNDELETKYKERFGYNTEN